MRIHDVDGCTPGESTRGIAEGQLPDEDAYSRCRPIPDAQDDCIEACLRGAISQSLGLSRSDVARTAEELWGTDAQD